MKKIIEDLYPIYANLLGEGYDQRLDYLKGILDIDVIEYPSGTEFSTWTVPDEWSVKEAWVKFKGKKIIDFEAEPLSLLVGSIPFKGTLTKEELIDRLHTSNDFGDSTSEGIPYKTSYYAENWGFCVHPNFIKKSTKGKDGKVKITEGLEEGDYEVFVDTETKPGIMKVGVHTIKGKLDKEILLFAHLDHPYQANDNLSAVACLVDLAKKVKSDYTIKVIFCPETIGSIGYAHTEDISKVEFVIALETCGNELDTNGEPAPLQLLQSWDPEHRLNRVSHCALQILGKTYKKGRFRSNIGSDETVFNDPNIGIPGICVSRWPYNEYHLSTDTPDKIDYESIKGTQELILKIIEIWGKDYIPVKEFKGPLMRSKYGLQSVAKQVNLNFDYLFYSIDGKKTLAELCANYEQNFDTLYDKFQEIMEDSQISRLDVGEDRLKETKE